MKRLPLILTLTLFVVLAGGYFLYTGVINRPSLNAWEVVPAETIFVYEGSSCESCLKELKASTVLSLINKAAFPDDTDSLTGFTDFILSNFRQGSLVSLHITKKDDFDFVFYLPYTAQLDQQFNTLVEKIKKKKGGKNVIISDREYSGVKIYEVSLKGRTFSWVKIDNILVSTFTPILIEDVIRTYNQETRNFKSELGGVYQLPTIKKDGGNIYLNLRKASDWLSLFSSDEPARFVRQLGQSALLDVKINDQSNFVLNGFSVDSVSNPNYILSSFSAQQPVSFKMKSYVSNRSLMFASYGISDGVTFSRDLQLFNRQNASLRDTLQKIATSMSVDIAKLTSKLSGELGVCWMESKGEDLSKILIINSPPSTQEWLTAFNTMSEKLSIDTVFFEKFAEYEIRELPLHKFPEKIFWPLVSGFKTSYYTSLGDAIFIGEDLEELKLFLEDIDREETWGKSVAQNQFLESTLLESNVSLYINTPRVWNVLENTLHPRWKKFVQDNRSLTSSLGMGAIQFSHLNDSYYTNISWAYKAGKSSPKTKTEVAEGDKIITNFSETLAKIFIVKSHVNKADEILLQDSTFGIRLLSSDGKVLWKLPLDGLIVGDVQQIDYLGNGKLQYLFATPGLIHVVDRLGNYVTPYPLKIRERDIEFMSIVDYDHSKKYRFLVAGKSGKLWMFDKGGTNLEGWTPKDIGDGLSAPARHYRIRGKDYIICVRKDGNVYMMNRRGEMVKNFPLNLNARPSGDYFLETGNSLENTYFVLISRDGFRIKFTMDGKVLSRESLVKNTVDSKFSLIPEKDFKSYLILRQEARQFTLFDENLKQIISSDFMGNNQATIQYLDFGAGKVYVTITDATQDLSFIYDGQGKLITTLPIESSAVSVRPLNFDKIRVFSILEKSLSIEPF